MGQNDCVFCKIIRKELHTNLIFENDHLTVILDIDPISEGHTLVIPKTHINKMHEVPDEVLSNVILTIKKTIKAIGVDNYNILQNNGEIAYQALDHVHWHIIPKRNEEEGLKIEWTPCIALSGNDLSDPQLIDKQSVIASKIKSNFLPEE